MEATLAFPPASVDLPHGRRPAILVSHLDPGGKEACVVALANALSDDGCRPVVVCFERAGALAAQLQRGVELVVLAKRPGNDPRVPWRLTHLFRTRHVDLVHCHNWGTLVEGVIAAHAVRVPVVHTQHGLDYGTGAVPGQRSRARTLVRQITGRAIHRIAAVSAEVADMLVAQWHIPKQRVAVIHNGIALPSGVLSDGDRARRRAALGVGDDVVLISAVGGLRAVKDFGTLIAAVARLVTDGARVRLVIAGDGPERAALAADVDARGLSGTVSLLGQRSDVRELLPLMDIFALSSVSEGVSIAILEAMAAGLPVVATGVGGNSEIVDAGRTGLLVPARAPEAFADALRALVHDPAQRRAFGSAGREVVRTRFSVERMSRDYRALYAAASQHRTPASR